MSLKAKDLAKEFGVSTATISLVLNNKPGVSEKLRREIIHRIKERGFEYMLKEQRGNKGVIVFVVYKRLGSIIDESPFFTYIIEDISNRVNKYGYILNFLFLNSKMSEEELEELVNSNGYKGLIIFATEMHVDDLRLFKDSNIPFTLLDNHFAENDVDSVAINNVQGISKAVNYLMDMGHTEIGYIKSKVRICSFMEREEAFKSKLLSCGLKYEKKDIIEVEYSEYRIKEGVKKYLENQRDLPTAFIAENDFIGCNALGAFQEKGYQIPEDISVIGFDDRPICTLVTPQLTTIHVPKNIFSYMAVDLLVSKMEQERACSLKIEVGTSVLKRNSVKDCNRNVKKIS
ncbi:MAG: LacI family DNA-binding transcriptional regulator [Lachnospiraceae bacterium]|nr:LacI family DNA-binding transcriptional regulator [Lachnospiraceae bacterium]